MNTVEEAANWKDRLPALKPGSETAIGLATATLSDVITFLSGMPGTGVFSEMARQAVQRQLEKAQDILVSELKTGNLEPLTDHDAEVFVPSAYRFYEAARQGEFEHNLRILARLIRKNATEHKGTTADVPRLARTIEGLSENELNTLVRFISITGPNSDNEILFPEHFFAHGDRPIRIKYDDFIQKTSLPRKFDDGTSPYLAIHELANRNLLTIHSVAAYGGSSIEYYEPTKFGVDVCLLAVGKDLEASGS